jgi:hypothetical protein
MKKYRHAIFMAILLMLSHFIAMLIGANFAVDYKMSKIEHEKQENIRMACIPKELR